MKRKLLCIVFALILIMLFNVKSFADFGDFAGDNDYGYDYDDNDYDYDYDYDNDYDYDYDDDDDYYYHSYDDDDDDKSYSVHYYYTYTEAPDGSYAGYTKSYNSDYKEIAVGSLLSATDTEKSDSGSDAVLGFIVVCIIAIIIFAAKRKNNSGTNRNLRSRPVAPGAVPTDVSNYTPMSKYTEIDPGFSETELKEKLSNLYIQMQNCWTDKNLETLRPYFTDALYTQYDRQLEMYRKTKTTNYMEKIAVLDVSLLGYKQEAGNDVIIARINSRFIDYTLNDNTGAVIRGNRKAEKFMKYEWTLTRKSGVTTNGNSGTRVINCPNCGAPVDINKSAKCEYCGSIISVDSTDWVINGIKGISQRTAY